MFTVRIIFLTEYDEYGNIFKDYVFEDINEARKFYEYKKSVYKDDDEISVVSDC